MKVLSITHQFPPYHQGGRAKHIQNLFKALSEKDVEIDVVTLGDSERPDEDEFVNIHLVKSPFRVDALNKFYFMYKARGIAKKLIKQKNYDIIIGHSTDGAFLSKFDIPFVVKLHGFRASWMDLHEDFTRRLYYEFERLLEKRVIDRADAVIAVSELVKRDVKKYYGVKSEVHENAISDIFRKSLDSDNREKDIDLLMVGAFVKRKGCHLIPDILQRFSEMDNIPTIVHVGKISDQKLYSQVKKELESKDLSGKLKSYEPVDREKLCGFYERAKLLIHPAVYDPFPKVPMEALARGTEVLVSDKTGGYEQLKERTAGIDISSLSDFPDKVYEVYNREDRARPDPEAIRSWEEVAEDTLQLFEKLSSKN